MMTDSTLPPGAALIALLGLASWSASSLGSRPDADPSSVIRPATLDVFLGDVVSGSRIPAEARLTNAGSRPAKIVGVPGLCKLTGCVEATDLPTAIPPHQSVAIRFVYSARATGTFDLKTAIYLDLGDRVGAKVPISFRGSAKGPTETP